MNWIKMSHGLDVCPEVWQIADETGLDELAVIGRLWKLWVWFDQMTTDGIVSQKNVTHVRLDSLTRHSGFAKAVENAGWLSVTDGVMILPNFDRHNGETAKHRARAAERQRESRASRLPKSDKSGDQKGKANPVTKKCDQRREEKIEKETPSSSPERSRAGEAVVDLPFPPIELPPSMSQIAKLVQPTTDEIRVDPWYQFPVPRDAIVLQLPPMLADKSERLNGKAKILTPDVVADLYAIERANRMTHEGKTLTDQNFIKDLSSFVYHISNRVNTYIDVARGHGLVKVDSVKPKMDLATPPCSWWREICAALYDGRDFHTWDWMEIRHSGREEIWGEFLKPNHTKAIHAKHAH